MTIQEAQIAMRKALSEAYPKGEIDAFWRIIMEEWMHYTPVDTILRASYEMPEVVAEKIADATARLLRHEPIQQIVGVAHFHGLRFSVNRSALIPRPETEQLVDMIVDENQASDLRVLDIGTGSGCIAISLARAMRFAQVSAFDISPDALEVAKRNAKEQRCRIDFSLTDILTAKPTGCYDIIVSNPPYICQSESLEMCDNVLKYEPHTALFVPDDDPLRFYRAITRFATATLSRGGKIYFEINPLYCAGTMQLLADAGFSNVAATRDFYGKERFVSATLKNSDEQ